MKIDKSIPQTHRWINDQIIIDFRIPNSLNEFIKDMEKMDEEDNWGYVEYADTLDVMCKELYGSGYFTKEQWNVMMKKYGRIFNGNY